jgi:hypothetical protein
MLSTNRLHRSEDCAPHDVDLFWRFLTKSYTSDQDAKFAKGTLWYVLFSTAARRRKLTPLLSRAHADLKKVRLCRCAVNQRMPTHSSDLDCRRSSRHWNTTDEIRCRTTSMRRRFGASFGRSMVSLTTELNG